MSQWSRLSVAVSSASGSIRDCDFCSTAEVWPSSSRVNGETPRAYSPDRDHRRGQLGRMSHPTLRVQAS